MMYAPHILYKRATKAVRNKYNEIVSKADMWIEIGRCRCDDNTTQHFTTDNGGIYTPKYHIVCDKADVKAGDYIKVENPDGGIRGQGTVYNAPMCNYLNYMSIYV